MLAVAQVFLYFVIPGSGHIAREPYRPLGGQRGQGTQQVRSLGQKLLDTGKAPCSRVAPFLAGVSAEPRSGEE